MAKGEVLLRAEVEVATKEARAMDSARREVDEAMREEFRGPLQQAAIEAMQDVAPEDTGLLKELIEGKVSFGRGRLTLQITSEVRDPATNYPYTGVTRFGHRKKWITAKHAHGSTTWDPGSKTIAGDPKSKFFLDKGHAPALAVHLHGRYQDPVYLHAVRGYRPKGDWVERGLPEANKSAAKALDRVGRRVVFQVRT